MCYGWKSKIMKRNGEGEVENYGHKYNSCFQLQGPSALYWSKTTWLRILANAVFVYLYVVVHLSCVHWSMWPTYRTDGLWFRPMQPSWLSALLIESCATSSAGWDGRPSVGRSFPARCSTADRSPDTASVISWPAASDSSTDIPDQTAERFCANTVSAGDSELTGCNRPYTRAEFQGNAEIEL